ncbi:MAG: hypothetical protein DMF99_09250 [Acidobacteria bacterium]|nr:MAG: hypothetical protein DMF99_09250 [Acidobacteriota bacterium]
MNDVATKKTVQVKRAYDPPSDNDGVRVLVDRLWPRGLSKTAAAVDLWLKDIAPSVTLRRWFNHDPSRWSEFTHRYGEELDAKKAAVAALIGAVRSGRVTLLFGARDPKHNNAAALYAYLTRQLRV